MSAAVESHGNVSKFDDLLFGYRYICYSPARRRIPGAPVILVGALYGWLGTRRPTILVRNVVIEKSVPSIWIGTG
jgi:hypothetical protein